MSYESKTVFINRLGQDLADLLTSSMETQILELISRHLNDFDMEQIVDRDVQSDDLLQVYMNALEIQGRSPKTIDRYRYVLIRLLKSVKISADEITIYHLREYLSKEKMRGISSETLEGIRQVFSAFFNWLHREGLIGKNPTSNLGAIKSPKKIKTVYSDIDIERLKQHCHCIRDRAIICFLYSTGCRISEVTQLNISDVDLNNLECIVFGKGSKERIVYLDPITGMILQQYLDSRTDTNEALFVCGKKPFYRLHPGGIRNMLTKLGAECGIDKVHPHKFRRTRATKLVRHGMQIQEVAAILGHEKLDTTMKYVVMEKNDIKSAYQKFA